MQKLECPSCDAGLDFSSVPAGRVESVEITPGHFAVSPGGRLFEYFDVASDCCLDDVGMEVFESTELFGEGTVTGWLYDTVSIDYENPPIKIRHSYVSRLS